MLKLHSVSTSLNAGKFSFSASHQQLMSIGIYARHVLYRLYFVEVHNYHLRKAWHSFLRNGTPVGVYTGNMHVMCFMLMQGRKEREDIFKTDIGIAT